MPVQLAVEATFLEAALQVMDPAAEMLPDNQARAVEKLAFDWVISVEKYVGAQYPELFKARDRVRPYHAPAPVRVHSHHDRAVSLLGLCARGSSAAGRAALRSDTEFWQDAPADRPEAVPIGCALQLDKPCCARAGGGAVCAADRRPVCGPPQQGG